MSEIYRELLYYFFAKRYQVDPLQVSHYVPPTYYHPHCPSYISFLFFTEHDYYFIR